MPSRFTHFFEAKNRNSQTFLLLVCMQPHPPPPRHKIFRCAPLCHLIRPKWQKIATLGFFLSHFLPIILPTPRTGDDCVQEAFVWESDQARNDGIIVRTLFSTVCTQKDYSSELQNVTNHVKQDH